MNISLILLVILSGLIHSLWNLLTKRSKDKLAFLYITKIFELLIFLPFAVYFVMNFEIQPKAFIYILASGIANGIYWYSLSRAYSYGDLSLVYPIARSAPAVIPIIAFIFAGERIPIGGILGIVLVNIGIFMITFESNNIVTTLFGIVRFKDKGVSFAFITLMMVILYSFIDKQASSIVNPLIYVYLFEFVAFLLLSPVVAVTEDIKSIREELRLNSFSMALSSIMIVISYSIVVYVMKYSPLSYIVSIREIGIVFGVIEGILILHEPYGRKRILASIIIAAGIIILGIFGAS
ncbi:MAG: EamA family transporter [Caldisericaceae bacterium]